MLKKKIFVILGILIIVVIVFSIPILYSYYNRQRILRKVTELARKKIEEIQNMEIGSDIYPSQELKLIYKSKEPYKYKTYNYLEISLDGKSQGVISKEGRKEYLVVDGREYGPYKTADLIPKENSIIFGGIDEEGYVVLYEVE